MNLRGIAMCVATMALGALAGCANLFGPSGPEVNLSLRVQRSSVDALRLRAFVSGRQIEVSATGSSETRTDWRGPRFGEVPVRVTLLDASGDILANADFTHRFERDHLHWIAAIVGSRRPIGHCIGSLVLAPLANSSADTLFVTYGGIPKGAVCLHAS